MFRFRKAKKSLHKKSTPFMIYYRFPSSSRIIFPYFWLQIHPFPSDKMLKISYFLTQVENDFFFPDKTQQTPKPQNPKTPIKPSKIELHMQN